MTQDDALALAEAGHSLLVTGAAGTGKTFVLNRYIERARRQGKYVAVTATTGLAATHLGGTTIHAWSGIGVRDHIDGSFFHKLSKQRRELITKADVLIIDEISMLHDYRLDMIEEVTRTVRGGDRPFGGLQVILCGDFFQLPPVSRHDSRQGGFIFGSKVWQAGVFGVCYLQQQFRQADDEAYHAILNGIRVGQLTRNQLEALQARTRAVIDPFTPHSRLLTTNVDVDHMNHQKLDELEGDEQQYVMESSGGKQYVESLKKSCLAPETLRLKRGAVVMCIKNAQDRKYVNGSLGVVEDFEPYTNYPVVTLLNGKEVTIKPESWEQFDGEKRRAMLSQLPLRLAWAITVHKSQGMTLDAARIDLRKAFVEGMGYVALSRVKGLKQLYLDGLNGMALRTSPEARAFDGELQARSEAYKTQHQVLIEQWQEAAKQPIEELPTPKKKSVSWQDKLEKMRETYPNAYMPWTDAEDKKLLTLHAAETSLQSLSALMGRHPGSITARLKKHFGESFSLAKE